MARIRRAREPKRTAVASYFLRRVDEEKRRHPDKTYAQIGRELGVTQRDPARLIRKLRTGETSGRVIVPELAGFREPKKRGSAEPPPRGLPGRFVVAYQWWYLATPDVKYWGRVNILIAHVSALDIFRLRDNPRVIAAVENDLRRRATARARMMDGSDPSADRGSWDFEIDSVHTERTQRAMPLIITGRVA